MPRILRSPLAAAMAAGTIAALAACGGGHSAPTAASPSASPTPTLSPSAKPPAVVATCPLTGRPSQKGQNRHRVALGVKIDNVDFARPQSGLDRADVVFEETVEGGLTRLLAMFQCDSATNVGPIRSARTSDGDMLRLLNGGVFAFSGANPRVLPGVAAASRAVLISYDALGSAFHRDYSRAAPHNVYSSTATMLGAGLARRKGLHAPPAMFTYGTPKWGGNPIHTVSLIWPAASAGWTWNGHVWLRTQNGSPDVLTGGHRIGVPNVVIMSISTQASGFHDVLGNASPDDVVTGSGKVWVLRDGHAIPGTWHRPHRWNRMVFRTSGGKVIPLQPGRTWVELLPHPGVPHFH